MIKKLGITVASLAAVACLSISIVAGQDGKTEKTPPKKPAVKKAKGKPKPKPELAIVALDGDVLSLKNEERQRDFPAACSDAKGGIWFAFVEHDGKADRLLVGKRGGTGLESVATLSEPGVIHQPAIAIDGKGTLWAFWGQTGDDNVVHLMARSLADGKPGELLTLAKSAGSDTFADAGTDAKGRAWVTWQSMRAGEGDIFSRFYDPAKGEWSDEIAVTTETGGDWEPRIAFADDAAWIVYDSSRGNEFNLYLAKVTNDGAAETFPVGHSPRYEGRADIAASADGRSLWIASERGRVRWGLDVRGHENEKGLNAQKEILFGRFDLATKGFEEMPLGPAGEAGTSVNLPAIGLDADGNPWVAYRYYETNRWQIAVTWWNRETGEWHARRRVPDSSMGQDRHASFVNDGDGGLWLNWPSDLRTNKTCLVSGVFLAKFDRSQPFLAATPPGEPRDLTGEPYAASQETPERPPFERHQWTHDGETYTLVWGDLHRHTDVSNCRTGFDGCIVEQFRYAYDMAKLDFLGTTDHTDIAKIYDPYEWWHNQRLHDVFHAPGQFVSLYAYEREQRWPWGHRNVVFAQRGGPIVYIKRANYRNSPWQSLYPVEANPVKTEIEPPELWKVLKEYGEPVAIVSHTGATGMGTDWGRYDESAPIDYSIENLVEIFQGARVSCEGIGAPQPTAGLRPGESYTPDTRSKTPAPMPPAPIEDFGEYNAGVYQNALQLGLRLGVFASSDHISQHVSYGGVYVKEFTREGIIEGFKARRTVAATDKIYVEFVCNGEPLGSIFETDTPPKFTISVDGTAPLKRVTLVRNEKNYRVWDDVAGNTFEIEFEEEAPITDGESRYYLRVEQT
ncbi:MAG: hypothetical protein KDN19_22765, partial [Verrucomicrobiae bacterium]|nr:hypothetical protein [Verrucomicrobiae bacterium]